MPADITNHHRRSIRLQTYDYAQPGAYFVTLCAEDRASLFGDIVDGQMRLNDAGAMIAHWWAELTHKFPYIVTDESVIMPNHFHGIIVIGDPRGQPHRAAPTTDAIPATPVGATLGGRPDPAPTTGAPPATPVRATLGGRPDPAPTATAGDAPPTLGDIINWFKTMTTNAYICGVKEQGWPPFPGKLWQRNYYEHVVRNEEELSRIRRYIADNPLQWDFDRENPEHQTIKDKEPWC